MAPVGDKRKNFASSTDSESDSDCNFTQCGVGAQKRTRQPKSFSKNAQIARQNRLKKKMYIETLEREISKSRAKNKKIDAQLKQQTIVIRRQEKEIKYMKNVLANSGDISRLLRCINRNTGMCVGTSLNRNLKLINNYAESSPDVDHPWSEKYSAQTACLQSSDIDEFDDSPLMNATLEDYSNVLSEPTGDWSLNNVLDDHAYTMSSSSGNNDEDDAGICLHISKHKVALEFCATCNDNANNTWSAHDI